MEEEPADLEAQLLEQLRNARDILSRLHEWPASPKRDLAISLISEREQTTINALRRLGHADPD